MTADEMQDTPEFLVALSRALRAARYYYDSYDDAEDNYADEVMRRARLRVEEYQAAKDRILP